MSVTLFEPELSALLDSRDGLVGRFMERKAQAIVLEAQGIVRDYFRSAPTLSVDQDIDYSMEGSTPTVGIRDGGNKSRRIARYEEQGSFQWMSAAVESERF